MVRMTTASATGSPWKLTVKPADGRDSDVT
jgi:hypothetical protein